MSLNWKDSAHLLVYVLKIDLERADKLNIWFNNLLQNMAQISIIGDCGHTSNINQLG